MLKRWTPDYKFLGGVKEDAAGSYVKWDDLLPLLREARKFAEFVLEEKQLRYGGHEEALRSSKIYRDAWAFLDATAALVEEKGVEG